MTAAGKQDRSRVIEYVRQALELDPAQQADQIIAARSVALRRNGSQAIATIVDIQHTRQQRQQILATLESLRASFWTSPLDQVKKELACISKADYPDLRDPVARLQKVAVERDALLAMRDDLAFDPIALESIQKVLVFPARETAAVREHLRRSLARPYHRKQRRQLVALLKQKVPGIYGLETEFFDSLLKYKPGRGLPTIIQSSAGRPETRSSGHFWVYWLVGFAALRLLRALFSD